MIKLIHELETGGAVTELNRYNHILTAFDTVQDMLEIDVKH
jgi:hypothetical protein